MVNGIRIVVLSGSARQRLVPRLGAFLQKPTPQEITSTGLRQQLHCGFLCLPDMCPFALNLVCHLHDDKFSGFVRSGFQKSPVVKNKLY